MRNKATANKKHLVSSLEGFFLQKLEETLANDMNELKGISEDLKNRLGDLIDRQDALTQDHGGSNAKPSDIITFDIDGQEMFARRDTLTAVEDSRLAALFSGRWEINYSMKGYLCRCVICSTLSPRGRENTCPAFHAYVKVIDFERWRF